VALHDRAVRGLAGARQRTLHDRLAVDGVGQRAPDRRVAQHGIAVGQRRDTGIGGPHLEDVVVLVPAHARCELRHDAGRVDRALLEQRDACVLVLDGRQDDALDPRRPAEVARVGLLDDPPSGLKLRHDVRTGADRLAVKRRGLEILARQQMLGNDPDLQLVVERRVGPVERELHGRVVDGLDRVDRVQQRRQRGRGLRVEDRLVGEHDVLGGERRPVGERHVVAQPDRHRPAVRAALRKRAGEIGLGREILRVAQQPVERLLGSLVDVVAVDRVQVVRLRRQRDHERAARRLRVLGGRSTAPEHAHPDRQHGDRDRPEPNLGHGSPSPSS
jgi:hypothetical protein